MILLVALLEIFYKYLYPWLFFCNTFLFEHELLFVFFVYYTRYLHSKGIINCDLKPSNILLNENTIRKVWWSLCCDFSNSWRVILTNYMTLKFLEAMWFRISKKIEGYVEGLTGSSPLSPLYFALKWTKENLNWWQLFGSSLKVNYLKMLLTNYMTLMFQSWFLVLFKFL